MALTEQLIKIKRVLGLECQFGADAGISYTGVLLKSASGKIQTEQQQAHFSDLPAFAKSIKEIPPVVLVLNGKGLIHKRVSWNESDDGRSLLQKALPNAAPADFYVQHSEPFNGKVFVSIVRRSQADAVLDACRVAGLTVISCSFGPVLLEPLLPLLENGGGYQYEFLFAGFKLSVVDGHLDEFAVSATQESGEAVLGEEKISYDTLLAFAAGFCLLAGLPLPDSRIERVSKEKEENRQKRLFEFSKWSLVIFFLLVLAVNFFVSDHYKRKKQDLEQRMAMNKDAIGKLETLGAEFRQKQDFLERTGLLQASRSSYYADELSRDLPATITLTVLNMNPFQKPKNEEDKITFQNKTIRITGVCGQSLDLNTWMQEVKKKTWVKELTLINYSQGKGMQAGEFILQLDVK